MKEFQLLNRETTGSELYKVPKCMKEQVLFRKNWFRRNIVESVLQMKKTKELKEFELLLYQNGLVSDTEHSNYQNNVPFQPKPVITAEQKRASEELPGKELKQPRVEDSFSQRLEKCCKSIHIASNEVHLPSSHQ